MWKQQLKMMNMPIQKIILIRIGPILYTSLFHNGCCHCFAFLKQVLNKELVCVCPSSYPTSIDWPKIFSWSPWRRPHFLLGLCALSFDIDQISPLNSFGILKVRPDGSNSFDQTVYLIKQSWWGFRPTPQEKCFIKQIWFVWEQLEASYLTTSIHYAIFPFLL